MTSGEKIIERLMMLAIAPCSSPCASSGTAFDMMPRIAGMPSPPSANGTMQSRKSHSFGARAKPMKPTDIIARPTRVVRASPSAGITRRISTACTNTLSTPKTPSESPTCRSVQSNFIIVK